MSKAIDVVSLYPKDMNIYGDSGNVLAVERRLALYGYEPHVHAVNQNDPWPEHADIILGGGGQDTGQKKIIEDLLRRADRLRALAEHGVPMLMICGLYQLFGEYFETIDGTKLEGISIIRAYTVGRDVRMIGNLVEHSAQFGDVLGYENHSGQTFLREGVQRVFISLGAEGVVWADPDGCGHIEAEPITVVDTTGAGDAMCAAIVHGYLAGLTTEECALAGNRASAQLCAGLDGWDAYAPY